MRPDYSDPKYSLNSDQLRTIRQLQRMPLWERRKHFRQWAHKSSPFIYKYLSFQPGDEFNQKKVSDLLVRSRLYLSAPSDFNDPYDFQAYVTADSNPVARRKDLERTAKRVLKANPELAAGVRGHQRKISFLVAKAAEQLAQDPSKINEVFNSARDRNGIACFSENPRNLLMWAHYAAGHTGISLQFEVCQDPGVLALAHRVTYGESLPHLQWPRDSGQIVDRVLLYKGKDWAVEQEVRYVSLTTVRDSIEFDGAALTAIFLGARFPDANKPALKQMLAERQKLGLPAVRIFHAEQAREKYGVRVRRVLRSP